jgi:hypothetical protein
MTQYVLSLLSFGIPMPQPLEAPTDNDAVWLAKGFVAGFISRNEHDYIGSKWRLDADEGSGRFDDTTMVGACVVEERDGMVGQQWQVVRRRWPSKGIDMNVGDPHDEDRAQEAEKPARAEHRLRKRSVAARNS